MNKHLTINELQNLLFQPPCPVDRFLLKALVRELQLHVPCMLQKRS